MSSSGCCFVLKTETGPSCNMSWMRYPGCSTPHNSFVDALPRQLHFIHVMKQNIYKTTLSSLNKDASGEGNSRKIFQTLNPELQIINVACNSQLLKSSSSSHATLTASFSFSSSKHPLHLGLSRSSTICGCDTWIPRKTSSFLKPIQLLLNSRTV